jgi:hypothetical protein
MKAELRLKLLQPNLRRKRKLIPRKQMEELHRKYIEGVPLAALTRELNNNIAVSTLKALLIIYDEYRGLSIKNSEAWALTGSGLFPAWLKNAEDMKDAVQQCPNGVTYSGTFPTGQWVYHGENK